MIIHNTLLILLFIFFVLVAGLFAGSETGLYRLSKLRLRIGAEKKKISFVMLNKCVLDSSGLLFSLLIGTNLSHYIATSIVTSMFLNQFKTHFFAEIFSTLLIAPILFIFSELIPKNLFFFRADSLMPYTAPFLYIFHSVLRMSGIIYVLRFISSLIAKLTGSTTSSKTAMTSVKRHAVHAILQDTHEEGILSSVQTDIINRLVKISNVYVKSVMIPMDDVRTVNINSDKAGLLNNLKEHNHTRLPAIDLPTGNIPGYVNIYEALSSSEQFTNLSSFVNPMKHIDTETNITDAIRFMQSHRQNMLLVVRYGRSNKEKPVGIVTMKDLVEEILGELSEW